MIVEPCINWPRPLTGTGGFGIMDLKLKQGILDSFVAPIGIIGGTLLGVE